MTFIYLAVAPALFTIISGGFIFIGQTSDLGLSTETQFPIFGFFDMIVICFLSMAVIQKMMYNFITRSNMYLLGLTW